MYREDKWHPVGLMNPSEALKDSHQPFFGINILLPVEGDKEIPVRQEPELLNRIGFLFRQGRFSKTASTMVLP